ncbi:site-specific integrase [Xanthomonas hortorum pv. vitians]|uniref:site-specific integrase n=1 Tax=Xanthomonas hortorum TaxID=56454 RepID=UPI001F316C92|nr:site-specific integrase [Xanthomonas hortorum]MCE4313375.1 site-specific integrase [Xanthomonas hortorum pv. vitians]MCE4535532.1 site-specific integrase [Xanthomonas hortorum pv. vitians]
MRIPHHLVRSPTGHWAFRQRVPVDLQRVLDQKVIKRTLHTSELASARLRALLLAAGYAQAFDVLRDRRVDKLGKKDMEALVERLGHGASLRELTLHRTQAPDGTISERWQIDNDEDLRLFRKSQTWANAAEVAAIGALDPGLTVQPKASLPQVAEVIVLSKAREAWLATIKSRTLPKTYTIKMAAVDSLVAFLGAKTKLHTITRPDLARWYQHMREKGASTPTLTNKQSYVGGKGGFFDWAIASGYYPKGDNPASGHVSYSVREKRARRKLGFKAYDREQIKTIFSPVNFERLSANARWAALIGLYTGARASEVGQLLVADVFKEGKIPCIRISDEGEHQKVKTEVSLRTVPLHPDLLALGFMEWVDTCKAAGHKRLFPQARADAMNGQGNWITKAFSRHLAEIGKEWPKAKRGFHSLRKSVIQELQGAGCPSELRAQIVGHELDDEHHATYSRDFTVAEKLNGLSKHSPGLKSLHYGLDVELLCKCLGVDGGMKAVSFMRVRPSR